MRAGFAENGEVGPDNYPRFPLFFGRFVLEVLVHMLSQNDQWHVVMRASCLTGLLSGRKRGKRKNVQVVQFQEITKMYK